MEKTKPVIQPTPGRRVLLFVAQQPAAAGDDNQQSPGPAIYDKGKPFDAGIAYVWSDSGPDANTINVSYADHAGIARSATSVRLYDRAQAGEDAHGRTDLGNYAVWMPYQFEQAMRAAAPKDTPQPATTAGRPADINLDERRLVDNGVPVGGDNNPPASLRRAEGLGDDATGEQLREHYGEQQDSNERAAGEAS